MFALAASSRRLAGPIVLALAAGLSACTVQPLYSTTVSGAALTTELAAISILPASDRLTQIVRNELLFAFASGATPRYELSLSADASGGGVNVTAPGNIASSIVQVTVRYTLLDIASGEVIESGSSMAETRYQLSNQAFANLRSKEDAEQRAAIAAAEMVRLEIASALAVRQP